MPRLSYDLAAGGHRFGAVINIERIRMAADVIAYFGEVTPRTFSVHNTAEADYFNLNIFIDKESFFLLYPRPPPCN
jgi:hypothetical protein